MGTSETVVALTLYGSFRPYATSPAPSAFHDSAIRLSTHSTYDFLNWDFCLVHSCLYTGIDTNIFRNAASAASKCSSVNKPS